MPVSTLFSSSLYSNGGISEIATLNICQLCTDEPSLYDYMYLCFMFNVSTIINLYFIDRAFDKVYNKRKNNNDNSQRIINTSDNNLSKLKTFK